MGYAKVRCTRITYVGELGYELYVPSEQALHVYDRLIEAGEKYGLKLAGLKALGSLRLEKGYRDFGHDVDNTDTVVEAGLAFTCDFVKPGGFIGRDKVLEERARNKERGGMIKRMVSVLCRDKNCWLYHGEVLLRDGVPMGEVRAGSHGFTVGGAAGLAMVEAPEESVLLTKKYIDGGKWEVIVGNEQYPVEVKLGPLFDPKNIKIKS